MIRFKAVLLASMGLTVFGGCATRPGSSTGARTPTPPSDRSLMKSDNQAALQALRSDQQALVPPTSGPATTRSSEQILSSLKVAVATITPSRLATTQPVDSNVTGSVTFTQVGTMLIVVAELSGLQPNSSHSLEIHDTGDLSAPDLSSAGEKWNPPMPVDHLEDAFGQLGNIEADSTGKVYFERTLANATVGGEYSVIGHSVIIRAAPFDRLSKLPNARIAGGVIERRDQ